MSQEKPVTDSERAEFIRKAIANGVSYAADNEYRCRMSGAPGLEQAKRLLATAKAAEKWVQENV